MYQGEYILRCFLYLPTSTVCRYVYWGEYPLGFAACLGQEECVRLLLAKGADPNLQDTNGNTIMHMLVIHDRKVGTGWGGQLHFRCGVFLFFKMTSSMMCTKLFTAVCLCTFQA